MEGIQKNMSNISVRANSNEIREDFCGMCLAAPLALTGIGLAGISSKADYEKSKEIKLFMGISSVILLIFILWYFKDCADCKI